MKKAPRPLVEDFETRILYSADTPGAVVATALFDSREAVQQTVAQAPRAASGTELVVIDARVDHADRIQADIAAQAAAGRAIEAVVLDPNQDGIAGISRLLAGRDDITALHIVSHGSEASVQLGSTRLDGDALMLRAGEIAAWGSHLAAGADLLIYGCDVGEGSDGRALVDDLAHLTGANVAASNDLTGASALGGNWTLEVTSGHIESALAIDAVGQSNFHQVLATYTVTNTNNTGAGSLRAAITSANGNAGTDTIKFNIAGTSVHTITLASALPTITGTVVIDATTDDSFAANGNQPAIVIDGNGLNANGLELTSTADGSTVRGLVVRNFGGAAISVDAGSDGNTIVGNYLGAVDATGNLAAAANASYTMFIAGANNTVGGTTAANRNVLGTSGGGNYGLLVYGASATGNQILGNYVGIGAGGSTAFSGPQAGISVLDAATTRIDGNVIAASGDNGMYIDTAGTGTVVNNNLIGTNAAGTARAGTADNGIRVAQAGSGTLITNNVIAGAGLAGIQLASSVSGVTVQGNRIGTDAAGTANWGTQGNGILLQGGSNNRIGGTGAGEANVIAFSGQGGGSSGISMVSGTGNSILGNSIYGTRSSSSALGIDLGTAGVNANDSGDGDTGANNLQNFPVLSSATTNASTTVNISGSLNSSASSYFRIEFFASPTANSNGYGEGKTYLGYVNVATNASGNATFGTTLNAAVPVGYAISATATKSVAGYGSFTDTSEFAQSITSTAVAPGVLVVDTASDTLDGDTASMTTLLANKGADGFISLREAIIAANNTANAGGVADRIQFGIAGTGVNTITMASVLPAITDAVVIDATTDDSFAANGNKPAVVLDLANIAASNGLQLSSTADGSTVRGLVIDNYKDAGIRIDAGSDGNTIAGNYLGAIDATGNQTAFSGTYGVYVGGANNTIGGSAAADRNVTGNANSASAYGVIVTGASATGNQILGNSLGLNAAGTASLSGTQNGVLISTNSAGNLVQNNVVSGNGGYGVRLTASGSGNSIDANRVGISASAARIGSALAGIYDESGNGNSITANWMGGGTIGIWLGIGVGNTTVQGNRIGTDLAGTANWGTQSNGINLQSGNNNNLIGGTGAGQGNVIAYANQGGTTKNGIQIFSGTGNALLGNAIYGVGGSSGLGIQLGSSGIVANDTGDADTGANNLQNFPVLTLAKTNGSNQVSVSGTLDSTANSYYRIEFFASASANATGYGDGQTYLGYLNVATNGSGNATISGTLTANVAAGAVISATATKSNAGYSSFTDTSGFAKSIVAIPATQATIVVDTTSDAIDGDTTSLSTLLANKGADGFVSLREAITATNNTANGTGGADRINFQIAGTAVHTIALGSVLPDITGAVILDASTDDSFAANGSKPAIVLDGGNGNFNGLNLAAGASGSTIRGLVITNVQGRGILINPNSNGNIIAGNYIGQLNAAGTQGSTTTGLWGIVVWGNDNTIGGITAADRNVISGTGSYAIYVGGAQNNQVLGNYFGSDASGNTTIAATNTAIVLDDGSTGNVIGGAGAAGNLFLGNGAVWIFGENSDGNTVQGNQIGLAADGTTVRGINGQGIQVSGGGDNNIIGGTGSLGNVVLGASGVAVNIVGDSSGNLVQGNYIGIDRTLTVAGTNAGNIELDSGAHDNLIGGVNAGEGNYSTASSSGGIDVRSAAGTGNALLRNLIWNTAHTGIDLQGGTESGNGATANDVGDADTGPNNLQNTPVLSLVKTDGSQVNVRGSLDSTAGSYFRLEFFAKPANGSSATYLGSLDVATDGSGNASFSNTFAAAVPVGYSVTATATRSNAGYSAFTDTSEFSAALDAGAAPVNTVPGAQTLTEDVPGAIAGVSVVDGGILAMTTSLGVLNGSLTVSLAGGATIGSGANNSAALTLSGTAAQVNAALATLAYLGHADYNGSDTLTMLSTDASASSDTDTVAITVDAANDAPVLAPAAPSLATITEDQIGNAGQTVASVIGSSIADVDSGALKGIAITALVSNTGTWQYSTDGGTSWTSVGAVTTSSALLLRSTDYVRFVPDGLNATSGSITYRGWDQTSGSPGTKVDASTNGGATAFSTASDTASITVTAVNDAPVLTAIAPTLATIDEDATTNSGQTVASFVGASITDADAGAAQGIAITGLVSNTGTWQYSINGGSSWTDAGTVSGTSALLLRSTDYMRFVPDGLDSTSGSITYRAWDQTGGSTGSKVDASTNGGTTAFSSATDIATLVVTAVNDAPVLAPIAPALAPITEDQTADSGQTVASFLGASVSDADAGAVQGIAITSTSDGNGAWQYSLDGGTSWAAIGSVAGNSALLLRAGDLVRFVPNGMNGTTGSISYRAWDQSSGAAGSKLGTTANGGSTAFSSATDSASIIVTSVNDAPALTPVGPVLTPLTDSDLNNPGQTVASFIGSSITDVDSGALTGIAISAANSGNGTWQYSIDGGSSWSGFGAVSDSQALLLRATDSVRLVPNGISGTTATFGYVAWDRTAGSAGGVTDARNGGGTSAFGTALDTATMRVDYVDNAPVLTPIAPVLAPLTEDDTANAGQTVASFIGSSVSDVDVADALGIAITGANPGSGAWQYSMDGGGSWQTLGPVSDNAALQLRASDRLRFVPDGRNGTSGSVTYRGWDRTSGSAGNTVDASTNGGNAAFSSATDTATITAASLDDAPVLAPIAPALSAIDEDQIGHAGQTVASFIGGSITDVDTGAVQGIAVTATNDGNGSWQYSIDGGGSWLAVGAVSSSSALLLRANDLVRVVPDGLNGTTASLDYRAWDQTSGSAGSKVDASASGGTTAFSTTEDTATMTVTAVNDAPVLAPIAPVFASISEDQTTNPGQTVASLLGASVGDVDTGASQGIAITATTTGNGSWQYSLDAGITWQAAGTVGDTSALLLRSIDVLRFVPNGQNATSASLTYRAWDQTSGSSGSKVDTRTNGGIAAFSTATDTTTISVTAVNDAPVLTPVAPSLTTITEDDTANAGQSVASFIGSSIADVDAGALRGIAITATVDGNGSWQYSTDNGNTWNSVGAVNANAARLLRAADLIRFVPNGSNATSGSISYRAWDQSSGSAGSTAATAANGGTTAFSTATDTASISVSAVNDAPVITSNGGGATASLSIAENDLDVTTVAATDADAPAQPISYLIGGGDDAALFTIDATTGLLRFIAAPDFEAPGDAGGDNVYTVIVRASDGQSDALQTLAITVTDSNDAPRVTSNGAGPTAALGVAENTTAVTTVTASDEDRPAQTLSFAITGGADAAKFAIDASTGALRFIAAPDFEAPADAGGNNVYDVDVRVSDGALGSTQSIAVTVSDVNDAPVLGAIAPALNPITEDDAAPAGQTVASFLGSSVGDQDAGALQGIAITAASSARGAWAYSVDGGSSWSAVGSVSTASALLLRSSDLLRFVPDGQNGVSATIGYRAWDQTSGSQGTRADTRVNGGGTAFSSGSDTAALAVAAADDAPAGADKTVTTAEDTPYVVSRADFGFSDPIDSPANSLLAVTITSLPAAGGLRLDGVAVTAGQSVSAADIDAGRLVFSPAANASGAGYASLGFRVQDDGGTANGGVDLDATTRTMTIEVTALNDAPVLTPISPGLVAISEDQTAHAGQTVASFIGSSIGDVDSGALQGIAITATADGNGRWQFSIDGGSSWGNVGTVSNSAALLLRASDLVRFVPDGRNATAGSIGYRAWDRTSGNAGSTADSSTNGGATAFSTATDTASITITTVNDAPRGANRTVNTAEDSAYVFATADFGFSDPTDSPANALLAVTITTLPGAGNLSLNGVALSAGQSVSATDIDAGLLRFTPALNANGTAYASFSFQVQDDGGTANGGIDLDPTARLMTIDVGAVNQAPVLAPFGPALNSLTEDQTGNAGQTVASFIGSSISDVDSGAPQGIAITATVDGNGSWQFSIDGGNSWGNVGAVSNSTALLLRASDRLRFVPDGQNGTTGSISYRAWDRTSGSSGSTADTSTNGGAAAFSTATDTASITITAVNDSPLLSAIEPALTAITEDETANAGQTVASFLGGSITDVDSGAVQGIAITATTNGNGRWQYSLDGGTSWRGVGSPSDAAALLLRSTDSLRFVPNGQNGTAGSITYRAWDQTSGAAGGSANTTSPGGTTAFSATSGTATLNVTAVNDAPRGANHTVATIEDTSYVFRIADFGFSDPIDNPANSLLAVMIGSLPGAGILSLNGTAVSAGQRIAAADIAAGLLQFAPALHANGSAYASFTFQVQDSGGTAAGGVDLDPIARVMTVDVGAVNQAPTLTPIAPNLASIDEDQTANAGQSVASFLGASISDADVGAARGIAITAASAGNGRWQYSIDAGGSWNDLGTPDGSSARLLRASDLVRFVSDGLQATTASFTYRAWDQTTGSAGTLADTGNNGGSSAFSRATDTATIAVTAVNDAPVLAADNGLTVVENSLGNLIGPARLLITDRDDAAARLVYTLGSAPAHGTLRLDGVALGVNDGFTQADIDAGRLRYDHDGSETSSDGFDFRIGDGSGATLGARFTITVTPLNDQPPRITSNGGGASATVPLDGFGRAVTRVTATDADLPRQSLVYFIAGGADAAEFAIDAVSGDLRLATAGGAERVLQVIVGVDDGIHRQLQTLLVIVPPAAPGLPALPTAPAPAPVVVAMELATAQAEGSPGAVAAANLRGAIVTAESRIAPAGGLLQPIDPALGGPLQSGVRRFYSPMMEAPLLHLPSLGETRTEREQLQMLNYFLKVQSDGSRPEAVAAAPQISAPIEPAPPNLHAELTPGLVGGLALSVGLLAWASRGSALLASLLVSAPAWRRFDLLPVLRQSGRERERDDDAPGEDSLLEDEGLPTRP